MQAFHEKDKKAAKRLLQSVSAYLDVALEWFGCNQEKRS